MKRMLFTSLLCVLIIGTPVILSAQELQTYYLSDGRIITGELVKTDEGTVYVETSLGQKSFPEDQIWKIEKDGEVIFENKNNMPQSKKRSSFASKYGTPTNNIQRDKRNMRTPVIGVGGVVGSITCLTGEFESDTVLRGNAALFVPGGLSLAWWGSVTVGFEVGVSSFSVETTLGLFDEQKTGTVDVNSVLFLLVAQHFPSRAPGIGIHANLGIAYTRSSVDDFDPWVAEDTAFLLGGGGGNIFLLRNLSLTIDIIAMFGDIDISDPTETLFDPWVDTFLASNIQFSGGIKLWF